MLEMEYSGFGGECHAYWCPGSLSRQSISGHGIGNQERQIVGLLYCEFDLLLLKNIQDMKGDVDTYFIIFKTIQHIKS